MSNNVKIAVFASGTGSNFEAIIQSKDLGCEIVLLICDKPGALVIEKAGKASIPVLVFNPKDYKRKSDYEQELVNKLKALEIEWIFLAGYMRIVGPTLLHAFANKIVNIHPSYLPAFPGKDAIVQAWNSGATMTGVTVHYVDEGIDTGPIIAQKEIHIDRDGTLEQLEKRVHQVEHQLYPATIRKLLQQTSILK